MKKSLLFAFSAMMALNSCSKSNEEVVKHNDKVSFTSSINGVKSRATASNFEEGDQISVFAVDGFIAHTNNAMYEYVDGKFISDEAISYDYADQELTFSAVYPYGESRSSGFQFTVADDQSVEGAYEASDLLAAISEPTQSLTPELKFDHKMAAIEISVVGGEASQVEVFAKKSAACYYDTDKYLLDDQESASAIVAQNNESSFRVVVVPQSIAASETFVKVVIDGVDYKWVLSSDVELASGTKYSCTATIKGSDVEFSGMISDWNDGGDITLEPTEDTEESASPKIGDYYYSDGTWSDGGLVSIDADGLNPVWAEVKPAPDASKTVIGIVCMNNPDRMEQSLKDAGFNHGYVIALRNGHGANSDLTSYSSDGYTPDELIGDALKLASSWYNQHKGYEHTHALLEAYPGSGMWDYPAFDWTTTKDEGYEFPADAPDSSSDWFVPSTGQLWDAFANLCGHEVAEYFKEWQTMGYDATYYCSETVSYDVIAKFNETIALVPAELKEDVVEDSAYHHTASFWTSTPYDSESVCIFSIGSEGLVECMTDWCNSSLYVRPILAF